MSGPQFFQTRMGQQFFEVTVPRIAEALGKIAERLEPTFAPGDLVHIGGLGEFRVVRSDEAGLHLESSDDGVDDLTLVLKRRGGRKDV